MYSEYLSIVCFDCVIAIYIGLQNFTYFGFRLIRIYMMFSGMDNDLFHNSLKISLQHFAPQMVRLVERFSNKGRQCTFIWRIGRRVFV